MMIVPDPAWNETARDWCQNMEDDLSSAHLTITPLLIGFRELAETGGRCNHCNGFSLFVQ